MVGPLTRFLGTSAVVALAAMALGAAPASAAGTDWPTFGFDTLRTGGSPEGTGPDPAGAARLTQRWATNVGAVINTQPLVAAGVQLPDGSAADRIYVGTEAGRIAALDVATGHVEWIRDVGATTPGPERGCPSYPDEVFGVTGTPVIDRSAGLIYVVGGDDRAYALRLDDGSVVDGWPVGVASPAGEHVWGALLLSRGRLYAGVASYCDQAPFTGKVVSIDVATGRRAGVWRVTHRDGHHPSGGGVWGWGGVSADPFDGDVYAATGNSITPAENTGYSERVVRLTRGLRVKQSNYPFRRRTVLDQDFGATPLLYEPRGCGRMLAAVNKNGEMLVYRRAAITAGPFQRLRVAAGSSEGGAALLGVPAFDAQRGLLYVTSPSDPRRGVGRRGLLAFRVTKRCRLKLAWHVAAGTVGLASAPTFAAGVVYFATGVTGKLVAVDARTGHVLRIRRLGHDAAYAAPTPVNGVVVAAGWDGSVRLYAPTAAG